MNPLTTPTDNLYKFLAIFGLIVTMFSVYVPLQRFLEYERVTSKYAVASKPYWDRQLTIARAGATSSLCTLEKEILAADAKSSAPDRGNSKTAETCNDVQAASAAASAAEDGLDKAQEQQAGIALEREIVWHEYAIYLGFGIGGAIVGVIMTVAGFVLWYLKLQRYLDRAVKAEAAPQRRPIKPTRGPHG